MLLVILATWNMRKMTLLEDFSIINRCVKAKMNYLHKYLNLITMIINFARKITDCCG